MLNKLKQIKITRKGVYLSVAICMLLIGCIGIYSSIKNMSKIIKEEDFVYEAPVASISPLISMSENKATDEITAPVISEEEEILLDFIFPTNGEISKEYSGTELVYSETMNDYRTHSGIDITAVDGTPVYSAESGNIKSIDNHPLWGNCITVEHENGYTTCYKNLSESLPEGIETGSYIEKGGIIGTAGNTALVEIGEQTHLHFEMYVNGKPVNPTEYIS